MIYRDRQLDAKIGIQCTIRPYQRRQRSTRKFDYFYNLQLKFDDIAFSVLRNMAETWEP